MIKKEKKMQKVAEKKLFRRSVSFPLVVSHLWYQRVTVMATNSHHLESSRTFQFVN